MMLNLRYFSEPHDIRRLEKIGSLYLLGIRFVIQHKMRIVGEYISKARPTRWFAPDIFELPHQE